VPELEGVRWLEQDLSAPLREDLPDSISGVVHLAQSRRYREFPEGAVDVFEINSAATVRLLDYCRRAGGEHFVYASSGAVYAAGEQPVHEDDEPAPGNLYGVSKLTAELALAQFASVMHTAALRFFFIYGPGQRNMFIPGIVERVMSDAEVTLAGEVGIRVNPVHVVDAAIAVEAALALERSGVFNVAGPDVVSLREIAEMIAAAAEREPRFANAAPQGDLVADIARMREHLGAPQRGIREGLVEVVAAHTA
jgi:nucleoside-diphosphate-sugar epimerase